MYMISVTCLLALTMVFAALTAAFRLFPPFGSFLRSALVALLVVSVRFYYLLLSRLAPEVKGRLNIDMENGLWRLAATMLLSLTIGSFLLLILGWVPNAWSILLLALHGLMVGLLWEEVLDDEGLQLGVKP